MSIYVLDFIKLDPIHGPKSIEAGETARFTCGLRRGGTDVIFLWTKNGHVLANNNRVRIMHMIDSSLLTIRETTVEDTGNYTCYAKNLFSETRETTYLSVDGKLESQHAF